MLFFSDVCVQCKMLLLLLLFANTNKYTIFAVCLTLKHFLMKKKLFIYASLSMLALTTALTISNTMSLPDKLLLKNIEALADDPAVGWIDSGGIYFCEERDCEVHLGIPPLVIVKHGSWYKCKEGGDFSCGTCDKNCDALL
jgi:hypothetical protein